MTATAYPQTRQARKPLIWLALAAGMVISAFAVFAYLGAQDSDQWWLLATGREIAQNGIPYTNPFDVYGDQAIVVQQWLAALIDYWVYEAAGYVGLGLMVLAMSLATAALAVVAGKEAMGGKNLDVAAVVAAVAMPVFSSYMSVRPQMWSMMAFLAIVAVMERYRRTGNARLLFVLPLVVLTHVNVHMAMMPFDFFIVACYLLPEIHGRRLSTARGSYKRAPLLAALAAMAVAALANPYGIDGALYLVNSYGAASYGDYIAEMGTTPTDTYYGAMMVACVVIGSAALGRNGLRKADLPLTALFLVTLALSFQHTRNVWLVALFAVPLVCSALEDVRLEPRLRILKDDVSKIAACAVGCLVILGTGVQATTEGLMAEPVDGTTTPVKAADWLDAHAEDGAKVFTHFNAGGYIEWRGYRVGMDARPELWNTGISKTGENRYSEYIDMSKGDMEPADYMEGKDYDYMIVNTDTDLYKYLLASSAWTAEYTGEGYVLFSSSSLA